MTSVEPTQFLLFRARVQRSLLYLGIAAVTLWVSIDVADSTILKPDILVGFTFLLAALWVGSSIACGSLSWHRTSADLVIALLLLTLLTSWSFSLYQSFGTLNLLSSAGCAICFFAGTQLVERREHTEQLIDFLSILSLLVCIIALVQFFGGDQLGIQFNIGSSKRVISTLGNAAYLGGFLGMMIPLVAARLMSESSGTRKTLLGALVALMVSVILLTQARSGIIAMTISLVLLFVILKGPGTRWILGGLVTVLATTGVVFFFLPELAERISSLANPGADFSFVRRIPFWSAGWQAVLASPVLGHGPGSVPFVIATFRSADYWVNGSEDIVPHIHGEILEVAVESGLIGVILSLALFGIVLRSGLRSPITKRERILGVGITCAIIAVCLDNMTNLSLRHPPVAMITWLLGGVLLSQVFQGRRVVELGLRFKGSKIAALIPFAAWGVFVFFQSKDAGARLDSDTALQAGRVASEAGKHGIAADHFRSALARNPSNLIAAFELCVSQLKTGRYREALATAEGIRAEVPDYPKIHLLESLAWLQLDSLTLAGEAINRELKRRDHPEAYYTQSLIHARLDDTVGVRRSLENVLERNIAAYSRIHLESTCRTLLDIALTREDLERLGSLLEKLRAQPPQNEVVTTTLAEVRRRIQQRVTP